METGYSIDASNKRMIVRFISKSINYLRVAQLEDDVEVSSIFNGERRFSSLSRDGNAALKHLETALPKFVTVESDALLKVAARTLILRCYGVEEERRKNEK